MEIRNNRIDICRLCKDKHELKNSHIIPEFIYKPLYDDKHRFEEYTPLAVKVPPHQKGIREYMLCGRCETFFSKYEKYAKEALYGKTPLETKLVDNRIIIKGVDYKKFRIFMLSIIWRASASKLDAFRDVKLGKHEEIIRAMLLNESPGTPNEYPVILIPIVHEKEVVEALIVNPTITRVDTHIAYRLVFGGMAWIYIISSHKLPASIIDAALSEDGVLKLIPWKLTEMGFITEMAKRLSVFNDL